MIQWIRNLINLWGFHKDSRWFEKNPAAQVRFEDNEDWIEELEERIIELEELVHEPSPIKLEKRVEKLEEWAHPKCGIEGFDGYQPLVDRIEKLEDKVLPRFRKVDD